ncbi:MAG TPA: MBL fold metallo-hydrolase [Chthonomonadaceae bacterium]|nr:MBL fold metallo-hydrolase [Chthonomonadaceae bacterium]
MQWRRALVCATVLLAAVALAGRAQAARGLEIYFCDTEGGAATLIVTPAGESTLIDCGNPGDRDADRIYRTAKRAGLKQIDNLVITHWHTDHYGGAGPLAKRIPILHFYDHGIPAESIDDPEHFPTLIAAYKEASHGKSTQVDPGDEIPLKQSGPLPVHLRCIVARQETIPDMPGAPQNPIAAESTMKDKDPSDNANSLGFVLTFGDFRFLDLGDLTWNIESKLVSPTDKIGPIDVYQSTHHGLDISNNPVVIRTVRPTVAIYNNGPHKGGAVALTASLRQVGTVQQIYQLHRNLDASAADNAPDHQIANAEDTDACKGEGVHLSVAADSRTYTVQAGPHGKIGHFKTREPRPHRI